jgi:hypothetical protein
MKHTVQTEINHDLVSLVARRNVEWSKCPARIQGGNWKMQGFRRSEHDYDETECQMSIAEFLADTQESTSSTDFAPPLRLR